MSWVMVGAAAVGAGAGIYGANTAAGAQSDAAKKNAEVQQQNMLLQLGLAEPGRALGYGAMSDLASLYGYNLPGYQTQNELMNPYGAGGSGGGSVQVNGRRGSSGVGISPFNVGGADAKFGGSINPMAGTVSLTGDTGKNAGKRDALLEEYLRTGVMPKGNHPKIARFVKEIQQLQAQGYKYDPNAAAADANFNPAASGDGSAGNMSRFFTSPDYTFRRDEGQRDIGNSFAARGGAASGNALRALTEFNSNLAKGSFTDYRNSLMNMAGFGTQGNAQAASAANNYTQGISQTNQQQGDARASGVLGTTNSIVNGINSGMNNYMMGKYMEQYGTGTNYGGPTDSRYGPYAGGYQLQPTGKTQQQQYDWRSVLGGY